MKPNIHFTKANILQSKLTAYAALAGALISNNNNISAQIVYHDLDPDYILDYPDDIQFLDLNSDGINDFEFIADGFINFGYSMASSSTVQHMNMGGHINALGENLVAGASYFGGFGSSYYINELNAGDLINEDIQFGIGSHSIFGAFGSYGWSISNGLIPADGDKYIGVKLFIEGDYHFGWIRLATVTPGYTYNAYQQIKDFAYEETAGSTIIAGEIPDCLPPDISGAFPITPSKAILHWSPAALIDHYELQIKIAGTASWKTINVPGTMSLKSLKHLQCSLNYEWRIRSICTDGSMSAYSPIQEFATASCRLGEVTSGISEFILYPNPANNIITVETNFSTEKTIYVTDALGQIMQTIHTSENMITINVNHFSAGIYFIKMEDGINSVTQNFIKQ